MVGLTIGLSAPRDMPIRESGSAYPGKNMLVLDGAPMVVLQMFTPGLPRPCMAWRRIIIRAHSVA